MTTLLHKQLLNNYIINKAWEAHESLIINREYRSVNLGENELLTVFPQGKKIVNEKIKEYETELGALHNRYQASLVRLMKDEVVRNDKDKRELTALIIWTICFEKNEIWLHKQLKRLKRLNRVSSHKDNKGTITDSDICAAKETPIENFLDFNRQGFTQCIFHQENLPSMKLYRDTNRWYCFGCNRNGDVVDIVMQLNSLDFIPAIKFILKK